MKRMVKIKNLKMDGKQVFWTVEKRCFHGDKMINCFNFDYFTNVNGEGIFEYNYSNQVHQLVGTCDFELKQKTLSGMRKALYRYYNY
ncbi:MAG: hypothetical protein IIT46_00505 [Lachnospiraceae bacterium]|nr:hypothetical protein [Lachnospiraceae bacterium]